MTWLFIRALFGKAFAWLGKSGHPMLAACVILALWGVYQRGQAHRWHNIASERLAAQRSAENEAKRAKATGTTIAKDNAHEHETRLAGDLALSRTYSRANRVQVCAKPAASGEGADTGAPVAAAIVPVLVAVPESDIDACTRNYDQALSAFEWTTALVDAGLGEVAK